jgi:hypothetical protein
MGARPRAGHGAMIAAPVRTLLDPSIRPGWQGTAEHHGRP